MSTRSTRTKALLVLIFIVLAGSSHQMQTVLDIAREINGVMLRRNLLMTVEEEWVALRRELNVLASVYYLPGMRTN